MAPFFCPSGTYYSDGRCIEYSSWYWWGRWVLTGILLLCVLILLLGFVSARRRRRAGARPFYGTGWMGGPPKYSAQAPTNPAGYYQPPPQYPGPPQQSGGVYPMDDQPTGQTFSRNDGYYGAPQDQGISPPPNAHTSSTPVGGPVYSPPPGPPPGKA